MRRSLMLSISILCIGQIMVSCGGSDGGNIDCPAYIDRQYECEILPPDTKDQLREPNIKICEQWDRTYKEEAMQALDACTAEACDSMQACIQAANQLCQSDISTEIDAVCGKAVECQVEDMTTMEECRTTMGRAQGMLMCLAPENLAEYVACYQEVKCANFNSEWLACYNKWVQGM